MIKQGDQIVAPDATTAYSIHATAGFQRQLGSNLVLTADYVMRRSVHVGPLQGVDIVDRNRYNRPKVTGVNSDTGVVSFVRDPVIPLCTAEQARALAPGVNCSTGPINIFASGANSLYHGVHVSVEKRFSAGWQFSGGLCALEPYRLYRRRDHRLRRLLTRVRQPARSPAPPPDIERRLDSTQLSAGPAIARAVANGWTISLISQTYSPPPLNTLLTGLDLDGDGISLTLLPGTTHNSLGVDLSTSELRSMVVDYNAGVDAATRRVVNPDGTVTVVRPRTPFNQVISPIVLPERF